MERSDPDGSPLARKKPSTRRKFVKEVYRPSNRKLPPNRRTWGSENLPDISGDTTASAKKIERSAHQLPLEQGQDDVKGKKQKPIRKVASGKPIKLEDKSNAQKNHGTNARITRSSTMTNARRGRSKIEVLDEQEESSKAAQLKPEDEQEKDDMDDYETFLDVSADQRIHPILKTSNPTQQSLGPDVTFTFDIDRHARALAGCPSIPRGGRTAHRDRAQNSRSSYSKEHAPPSLIQRSKAKVLRMKLSQESNAPSPSPKKRTRSQTRAGTSKVKTSSGSLSDDPLMI